MKQNNVQDVPLLKVDYTFGQVDYYDSYVIGTIREGHEVNTQSAREILNDINNYYQDRSLVYISNRSFNVNIDPQVYKLVDPKKLRGIAIVGDEIVHKDQAIQEQSLYKGSFTFFSNVDDAISWAKSFRKPYR